MNKTCLRDVNYLNGFVKTRIITVHKHNPEKKRNLPRYSQ